MEYFKNSSITISYFAEEKLVRTKWHGFVNSKEYRKILGIYLDVVREKNVTRWIGDNTNAKAIRPSDQEWTAREWAPLFSEAGNVYRMAVIVAEDIFNKMAVENIMMKASDSIKFTTRFFSHEEDAYAWVMEEGD